LLCLFLRRYEIVIPLRGDSKHRGLVPRCNGSLGSRVASVSDRVTDRFAMFVVVRTLMGTCGCPGTGRDQWLWQVPVGVLLKSRARGLIALALVMEYNIIESKPQLVHADAGLSPGVRQFVRGSQPSQSLSSDDDPPPGFR